MVKIIAWYDNESGFSHRLCDLFPLLSKRNPACKPNIFVKDANRSTMIKKIALNTTKVIENVTAIM